MTRLALVVAVTAALAPATDAGDFASLVIDYTPAPGQIVNAPSFNDPSRALGPPVGGGTLAPNNSGLVTLGGFGGSITLAFDSPVLDDPRNPMGLDCIVFGNAFWPSGDPSARFAEAGVIEIALDSNGNGLADDPWFLIPGSHLAPPVAPTIQPWDADAGTPTPPTTLSWYPAGAPSPMTTATFALPGLIGSGLLINTLGSGAEMFFGSADLSPTLLLGDMTGASGAPGDNLLTDPEDDPAADPALFYTTPDDPLTVGVDPGSGGGDAFDIASAVDPATGAPANLPSFDFIRISTGVNAIAGPLGEVSTEIDAVADVRPATAPADLNGDGFVSGADISVVLNAWGLSVSIADLNGDGIVDGADISAILNAWSPAP